MPPESFRIIFGDTDCSRQADGLFAFDVRISHIHKRGTFWSKALKLPNFDFEYKPFPQQTQCAATSPLSRLSQTRASTYRF